MEVKRRKNPCKTKQNKIYCIFSNTPLKYLIIIIFLALFFCSYEISEIKLIIEGQGQQNFLCASFNLDDFEIKVNEININSSEKSYAFNSDLNNVTIKLNKQIQSCENMFKDITGIKEIDLSNLNISNVSSMSEMFNGCSNLEKIIFGNFFTSSLINMNRLFYNCSKLTSIDLSKFDTSKVTNMVETFSHCENLKSIDVSNFNTEQVEDMTDLFAYCYSLTSINLSNFNTSKVKIMKGMFYKCHALEHLNLSIFDTSLVNNFESMFAFTNLTLNINLFKIKVEANISSMFENTSSYLKICLNDLETKDILKSKGNNLNFMKIELKENKCVEYCNESNYKYEYDNLCYDHCPNGTYAIDKEYLCLNKTPEGYYLDPNNSFYKKCFNNCKNCNEEGNEMDNKCLECKNNFTFINDTKNSMNCYEICPFYYYFDNSNNYKCTENKMCPKDYNKLIVDKNKCIDNCRKDDIFKYLLNDTCVEKCPNGTIFDENSHICFNNLSETSIISYLFFYSSDIGNVTYAFNDSEERESNKFLTTDINDIEFLSPDDVLKYLQNILLNRFNTGDIDNGIDLIYTEGKVTFTITTPSNQRNNSKSNATLINLGKCENILKGEYSISEDKNLYIFKIDYFTEGLIGPKVEYEVYYPSLENHLKKANLSLCSDVKIDVSIPINLSSNEIDKYNASSGFYNDLCYVLTTESGTDESLNDRRNEFVNNNLSICEEDCQFTEYDIISNRAICSCYTKIKLPLLSEIKVDKDKFFSNFYDINNIANIKMLKCIKLLFDKNNIFNNSANYILIILFLNDILASLVFCCYNNLKIIQDIKQIYIETKTDNNRMKRKTINEIKEERRKSINRSNKINQKNEVKNILNNNEPPKKKNITKKRNTFLGKVQNNRNILETTNNTNNNDEITSHYDNYKHKRNTVFLNINNSKYIRQKNVKNKNNIKNENSMDVLKRKSNYNQNLMLNNKNHNVNVGNYTDNELNSMDYEEAIKFDQRNYYQYYLSLIKNQHLLIFTFFHCKDYNSQMIKLDLFLFSFSINYIFSAMFYSDDAMHKIYVDQGKFDIIYQLPQMIYSSIISFFLEFLLNNLGLYEENILEARKLKKKQESLNNILHDISSIIKIKIIFFFIITFLLTFAFWIYLGCFCAVYKNTQIHLLKEVLSSFMISFLSPFISYLIP